MKISFAVACLLSSSQGIRIQNREDPVAWKKETLPDCPDDTSRTIMDDGRTHVVKYPYVGASCKFQTGSSFVQVDEEPAAKPEAKEAKADAPAAKPEGKPGGLDKAEGGAPAPDGGPPKEKPKEEAPKEKEREVPDFVKWKVGDSSKTKEFDGVEGPPTSKPNFDHMRQREVRVHYVDPAANANLGKIDQLQHCPNFNDRFTLQDGHSRAIPYPEIGYNCNPDYNLNEQNQQTLEKIMREGHSLSQIDWVASGTDLEGQAKEIAALEHCPDFDERMTLVDGKTRAIAYPNPGYNCHTDHALSQKEWEWPLNGSNTAGIGADVSTLEHCPDFDERHTLVDGKTKGIPYPQPNYNCNPSFALEKKNKQPKAQSFVQWSHPFNGQDIEGIGKDISTLEHCPDFDERFTLVDGKTKGIPYPQPHYNCNPDFALAQKKDWVAGGTEHARIAKETASLEQCPDFDERMTLVDGKTKAIAYPAPGYNCHSVFALQQKEDWVAGGTEHERINKETVGLEKCPDFDERMTLVDGKTKAIAYPAPGYNCHSTFSLAQWSHPFNGQDIEGIGKDISTLEHCPDFDERFTLVDGKTRGIPYPQPHYNCNPDYAIWQKSSPDSPFYDHYGI